MKKAYRERALGALFAAMQSGDFDKREYALFQLAQLLRRAQGQASALSSDELPRELRRLRLSAAEQTQAIAHLTRLIAERPASRATAFLVLAEAAPPSALASTLALITACGAQLDEEAAFQACAALRRWLAADGAQIDAQPAWPTALPILRRWAAAPDRRLAQAAKAVLLFFA